MAQTIYDKSIIEMLVLFLLQKEELYAYSMLKKIRSLSGDALVVQGGSLYPILYKLTEKGYIADRVEMIGKRQRMSRVYYRLTDSGQEYLQSLITHNELVQRGIQSVFQNAEGGGTE